MILILDNYDSFTYNLYQLVGKLQPDIMVRRNDEITLDEIKELQPDQIIISLVRETPKTLGTLGFACRL